MLCLIIMWKPFIRNIGNKNISCKTWMSTINGYTMPKGIKLPTITAWDVGKCYIPINIFSTWII